MHILKFLLTRLFSGLIILISVVVLISSIVYLAPVDPARLTFGQRSDASTVEMKRKELGLDQSLSTQMLHYLADISPIVITKDPQAYDKFLIGQFGLGERTLLLKRINLRNSYQTGNSVSNMISQALPKTIILACASFIFAAIFGMLLGLIAAIYQNKPIDKAILALSTLGISVPSYVAAIVMAVLFGYVLHNLTGLNIQGSIFEVNDYGDDIISWKNLILPMVSLGIRPVSIIMQLTRSAVLEVMSQDYIRTAKAKGLDFIRIMWRHTLPNAMNPIVTSLTGWLASLLAGAYFVEKVFNFKGIGELTINGLVNYDLPVILACVILICLVFILINILTDIFYMILDPKMRN